MPVLHAAEQPVGEAAARRDRDRRQRFAAGHVADRVDARHVRVLQQVGDDLALRAGLDAGLGEPEIRRNSASRPTAQITSRRARCCGRPRASMRRPSARFASGRRAPRASTIAMPSRASPSSAHRQHLVELAQHAVRRISTVTCVPSAANTPDEFRRDIAAADERDRGRLSFELEESVRADAELRAGKNGAVGRPPVAITMCGAS